MEVEIEVGSRLRGPRLLVVGLVVLSVLFVAACGATPTPSGTPVPAQTSTSGAKAQSPAKDETRTSNGGQVTIQATWARQGAGLIFTVALDTHSVDLDGIDLAKSAILRTDSGVEAKPIGWDAPKGGHHRSGTLTFPTTSPDGTLLVGPDTRFVELVILGVAGVPERTLGWELSS